ncbi:MAG: ATP-binding protein [Hyphomicrobiales bacterium]
MDATSNKMRAEIVSLDQHRRAKLPEDHLSILFVEDDDVDAKLIELALKKSTIFNIELTRARTINEARDLFSIASFDLMLLDFWLGAEPGLSLVEELGGRRGKIPVVLLTGHSDNDIQSLGHQAGALGFISKDDLTSNTLDAVIRSTLHTHQCECELLSTLTERDRVLREKLGVLGKLSRQLEQPLNAIAEAAHAIATQAARDGLDDCYISRTVNVRDSAQEIKGLVQDLIKQAPVEQYHAELSFDMLDMRELISKAIRLVGAQVDGREQTIDYHEPDLPIVARVDQTAMLQALLNVMSNASKFSPCGSDLTVTVDVTEGESIVSVRDQGIGMSKEEVALAMQPIGRATGPAELEPDGIGLGLQIAASILDSHGGRIDVQSTPAQGTEVKLILPLAH